MTDATTDADLTRILRSARVIACMGVSTNPVRPSYFVARYLHYRGYELWGVNPAYAGQEVFGRPIVADLSELPDTVDMLDVFRRSEAVPAILDQALEALPNLRTLWLQIGVTHTDAAAKARAAGLDVVQDRCPKIEYQRLFGELRKAGVNTKIISSRLPDWT